MTNTLGGPRGREDGKRWTQAKARSVLEACAASGLSVRSFAEREGLEPHRLYRWSKRLGIVVRARRRTREAQTTQAPAFVPLVLKRGAARSAVVIRHGESTTLEIDDATGVSPAWVAAIMIELERAACS
ncbi:MAG: hypothetical protein KF894_09005 [Labilithrix sp.]|nr:hypothetical protein [Labilithrix sp.]